jgi:hypothetical protein
MNGGHTWFLAVVPHGKCVPNGASAIDAGALIWCVRDRPINPPPPPAFEGMPAGATGAVRLTPITDPDVRPAATFLHEHLNDRVSAEQWAEAIETPWEHRRPNAGFMLVDAGRIVGVQLAFYSERLIEGRRERFCNLGAWCVLPGYRLHSLRLLRRVLEQDGHHFTDLSPSGNVVEINSRLGFRFLDAATVLVPNIPWPGGGGKGSISAEPELIESRLSGRDLQLYRDHAAAPAARHLVLIRGEKSCYVVFRKERYKRLRAFVTVLHVGNPGLYREFTRPLARHLLFHHGAIGTLAEPRVLGHRPRPSYSIRAPRRRMFRGSGIDPRHVDYLYSELVCVAW